MRERLVVALIGAVIVGFWVLPELYQLVFSPHPIENGTRLSYKLVESSPRSEEDVEYQVSFSFEDKGQGELQLLIESPYGERKLAVFADSLAPTADKDNDELEFPTPEKLEVRPRLLWLPPERRVAGTNCVAGRVQSMEKFNGMPVWPVMHPDGFVYYHQETGLLAGFELEYALTKVSGRLRSLR